MFTEKLLQQAADLLTRCRTRGYTLATAESCTGGLISALLTDIPGSSDVFMCGFVTYSYASKTDMLGVDAELIAEQGAVSEAVAQEMAKGALANAKADIALGVTGIAGPGGGTPQKPVGMVCIAMATRTGVVSETCQFSGNRSEIRLQSVARALAMAATSLLSS